MGDLLRQAVRSLRRRPAHTVMVTLTLGLGIGAGTVVAVLVRDVIARPLPYDAPDRLVRLDEMDEDRRTWWPSRVNFEEWRAAGAAGVEGIEAATVPEARPVLFGADAGLADVSEASSGLFPLLGARFERGRAPAPDEFRGGGVPVAVVSHAFWVGALGQADLDGVELTIGTERFPVVGVLNPDFGFVAQGGGWGAPDVWLPLERHPDESARQSHGIHVVARVSDNVSLENADDALDRMAARVAEAHAEPTHAHSVETTFLEVELLGGARRSLGFLLAGAAGVLLVAALNLSGSLLVDGLGRAREMAVRRAVGAGRRHVIGQFLLEAALAALPGAVLGWLLALLALTALRTLHPGALPRLDTVSMDAGVFVAALVTAAVVALVAAVLPPLLLSGGGATAGVTGVGRSGPSDHVRRIWNGVLILQVALTFTLLAGTAALGRSLLQIFDTDLGFEADRVSVVQVTLPESRYPSDADRIAYFDRVLASLRGVPAVAAASITNVLPHVTQARISGTTNPDVETEDWTWAAVRLVDASYFDVLDIPFVRGEMVGPTDAELVVVDRTVERKILDEDAVGRRVRNGMTGGPVTAVGVVGPVREWGLPMGAIGTIYRDFRAAGGVPLEAYLLVRGQEGRSVPLGLLRETVAGIDRNVPISVEDLETGMARTLGSRRLVLVVTAAFGALGLIFAALGVYGIVSYIGRRKARESGVRLALGARPASVRSRALADGIVPTAGGLMIGLALALVLARIVGGRVEGLEAAGGLTLMAAGLALGLVATAAAWIPARRVTRIDLVTVLREE